MTYLSHSQTYTQKTPCPTIEKYLQANVCKPGYYCFIHYSKKLDLTYLSINRQMDNENLLYYVK